jgi:hypothetical protein
VTSRDPPAQSMSRSALTLPQSFPLTSPFDMLARLARVGCQRQLGPRNLNLPGCNRAPSPARLRIAWVAAAFLSTNARRVVLIDNVPRGTTIEQLQATLPFPVATLTATGAS